VRLTFPENPTNAVGGFFTLGLQETIAGVRVSWGVGICKRVGSHS